MNWINIALIIISVLLATTILLQQRGAGAGNAFGGGDSGSAYQVKRGFEKMLFNATIVLAALFIGTAFARLLM